MKIAVIGSGSWGTALAALLAGKGNDVYLWSRSAEKAELISRTRENAEYLPGITLPENIICTDDAALCTSGASLIVSAVPSTGARGAAKMLSTLAERGSCILNMSKGLEPDTLLRLSEVYSQEIPHAEIAVMSGPSHAEEVSRSIPTTNVAASANHDTALFIQDVFMDDVFRVYTSVDLIGVEIGGALKNVIALCAGISDGLGYGDNTKAALMTRGIAEIARLGTAMGAKPQTFSGLSGIGDLIVTCTSMHSRNRRAGILIGQGKALADALSEVHMVVEGVATARAAHSLAEKYGVCMPIVNEAYAVLFENKPARRAVLDLMTRDKKQEIWTGELW